MLNKTSDSIFISIVVKNTLNLKLLLTQICIIMCTWQHHVMLTANCGYCINET